MISFTKLSKRYILLALVMALSLSLSLHQRRALVTQGSGHAYAYANEDRVVAMANITAINYQRSAKNCSIMLLIGRSLASASA